jgi:hypothetical protein
LHELRICRNAPGISHLLFADDTLLFLEATEDQIVLVNDALWLYEKSTGQLMNPQKCSILFGADCSMDAQDRVKDVLKVSNVTVEEKYLGLPTPDGRMGMNRFVSLKEKLISRLSNWAERNMSSRDKEVLIKAVAQAIPTYVMSVFKVPVTLCDELTQLIRRL